MVMVMDGWGRAYQEKISHFDTFFSFLGLELFADSYIYTNQYRLFCYLGFETEHIWTLLYPVDILVC